MTITSALFVKSINGTDKILYDGKFQVAFVGRSNVGKSSCINSLVHEKLARSSKAPGKTKHLDIFLINNKFYFVDFPGYGFAHASGDERERYRKMMMWYFEFSEVKRRTVIHIVDSVVGMTAFDLQMVEYLEKLNIDRVIIANKIDKLSKQEQRIHIDEIVKQVGGAAVIPYSTKTNEGRSSLLSILEHMV
ncbi:MAG: ribosome biogenesis GTP-binding protein YihA/YsxC [Candidatus Gottesmanbacteria bacterium]